MTKKTRFLASLLSSAIICGTVVACSNKDTVVMEITNKLNGQEMSLYDPSLKTYLNLETSDQVAEFLNADENIKILYGVRDGYVNNKLKFDKSFDISWTGGTEPYSLVFSTRKDFTKIDRSYECFENSFTVSQNQYFLKNKTYYYKIVDSEGHESKVDSFQTDTTRVFPKLSGIGNVRDIGGIKLWGDEIIGYGKLFRGGKLESATKEDKAILKNELGIKTDLDLRGANSSEQEIKKLTESPAGLEQYKRISIVASYYGFWNDSLYKDVFKELAKPENYPIYIHCAGGADRTGTVMMVLEALLGANYEEICKDYELTTFSEYAQDYTRWRNDILKVEGKNKFREAADFNYVGHYHLLDKTIYKFVDIYDKNALNSYSPSKSLSEVDVSGAAKNYLKSIGITDDEIESIMNIFIN